MLEEELESRIFVAFNVPDLGEDFSFLTRRAVIDWSEIATANIDRIVNERDFAHLKKNVQNVLNYEIESVSTSNILDKSFIKLFRLAQLTIEYLLYVQNYYHQKAVHLSEEEILLKQELEKVGSVNEYTSSMDAAKISKNGNSRRKESHLALVGNEIGDTLKCAICGKIFLNGCYLYAHHQRRHSASSRQSMADVPSGYTKFAEQTNRIFERETEKIWKELEWMRRKVNSSIYFEKKAAEREESKESVLNDGMKKRAESLDELGEHERGDVFSSREELSLDQDSKENLLLKGHIGTSENARGDFSKSVAEHMSLSLRGNESRQEVHPESSAREDNGRLEAQERAWRGRLKAVTDQSSQEIESLRQIISSLRERGRVLEEEYHEKIDKLTAELKYQRPRQMVNKVVNTVDEVVTTADKNVNTAKKNVKTPEKNVNTADKNVSTAEKNVNTADMLVSTIDEELEEEETVVPPIPSIAEGYESPASSGDSTISTPPPMKRPSAQESPNRSSASSSSKEDSNVSDVESASSDAYSPPKGRRSSSDVSEESEDEEEEENESDSDSTVGVFGKKLGQLGVDRESTSLSDKEYKEKMEALKMGRKLLLRNIKNYHQIRSHLDEKADARVSQKLLKLNLSTPRENSSVSRLHHKMQRVLSKTLAINKTKESPLSASSSKDSFVTSTSRSSHSQLSTGRTLSSKSSVKSSVRSSEEELSRHPRLAVIQERPKGSQGSRMTVRANVHPTSTEDSGAASMTSSGTGYYGAVGSILRGLTRTEGQRAPVAPSVGIHGSKSVSFARDVVEGKIYRAV